MPKRMRSFPLFFLFFFELSASGQQSEFGLFYQYGAFFNVHQSNKEILRATDGSAIGGYFQLNNGSESLGFRASLAMSFRDAAFYINDQTSIWNINRSGQLKLQCTLPIDSKNTLAMGFAPSIITSARFHLQYLNKTGTVAYGEQHTIQPENDDLNELGSAICLSWYHQIKGKFFVALHLDQDMMKLYSNNIVFDKKSGIDLAELNIRHSGISAAMIFQIR
jgi:hypothetical protein